MSRESNGGGWLKRILMVLGGFGGFYRQELKLLEIKRIIWSHEKSRGQFLGIAAEAYNKIGSL